MQYEVTIRRRRPCDIPELVDVLLAQQPETRYPFKDPLPIPVEDFLHASDATKAWTAGPCLEVLPMHPAALSLYLATGWRVVHRFRPDWLRGVLGEEGPDVHVMAFVGVEVSH